MKKIAMIIGATVVSIITLQQAQATSISGSVNMGGGLTLGVGAAGDSLATATEVASFGTTVVSSGTQTYSSTAGASVAWNSPLLFAVGPEAINNLWSFTSGASSYTFSLASVLSYTVSGGDDFATLKGTGTLTATGYTPTTGNFTLTLTDSSSGTSAQATFGFGASNTAQAPDGGLTVALLGGSLIGLQVIRRKIQG